MRLSRIVLLGALCVSGGCYSYQVVSPDQIAPDTDVRVRLSPQGADGLQNVRMTEDRVMEGKLIERRGSTLLVETNVGRFDPAVGGRILTQVVSVDPVDLTEVEIKELDKAKTGLLAGGAALVVGIIIAQQLQDGSGGGGTGPPGPPESRVDPVPLFRIPLGFPFR